jgi:hypothetical protein
VTLYPFVMPGLVPGIHVFLSWPKTWMAGTSPAMTKILMVSRLRSDAYVTALRSGVTLRWSW